MPAPHSPKKYLLAPLALAMSVALVACDSDNDNSVAGDTPAETAFQLQLLHFADVDGGRNIINNVQRFSAILETFKAQYPNTVILSSGDNWIPGPEYSVAGREGMSATLGTEGAGRAHVDWLNQLGVQASALGNHEFDLGPEAVASIIAADDQWSGARFPYLSANLDFSASELAPLVTTDAQPYQAQAGKVAKSTVIEVNGQSIGVVGATTPTLAGISSPTDIAISPTDPNDRAALAAIIQAEVDALSAQGINKIIVLSHMQQIAIEKALAPLLRDVDVIVAGGSNTILADDNDLLRAGDQAVDNYPLSFTSASGQPTVVVNTDGDYTYLGRLLLDFDAEGQIITSKLDSAINGAWATDDSGMLAAAAANTATNAQVAATATALKAELEAVAGNIVGRTDVYLEGERLAVRTRESNFGRLTAEANLWYAQQQNPAVAISLKNGGGIRAAIGQCTAAPGAVETVCKAPLGSAGVSNPGDISQLDVQTALRFNNGLTTLSLTGDQLHAVLEHAVSRAGDGNTPGEFPQVAGIRVEFDVSEPAREFTRDDADQLIEVSRGQRIRNLTVLDSNGATEGGEPVVVVQDGVLQEAARAVSFDVVTLGFLAGGGDSYPFPQAGQTDLVQEGVTEGRFRFADEGTEQDVLAEYFGTFYSETPYNLSDEDKADDLLINVTP